MVIQASWKTIFKNNLKIRFAYKPVKFNDDLSGPKSKCHVIR